GEHILRGVAVGAVAIVNRPTEGRPFLTVAVAANGQVMAGELERELARGGIAEDVGSHAIETLGGVPGAAAGDLVPGLVIGGDGPNDLLDEILLLLGVNVANRPV